MQALIEELESHKSPIAVVGLGYVGLPLACLLASKFRVLGFDISKKRVDELRDGIDKTGEIDDIEKLTQKNIRFSYDVKDLQESRVIIVAVPTPIDSHKKPDLTPILGASKSIGENLSPGSLVIYESTVYPGLTENECCRELEKASGLKFHEDFELGYSPERVNPGDRLHTIEKIVKVVSASTPESLEVVDSIYSSVIEAGTHRAPNIASAEAAKVIENTQRDVNIALINELSIIFEKMGLDTGDVLAASQTKWNFLPFKPGLVGGHCIGVDPYYLTYLAEGLGIHPQVISSGRKINDFMPKFVAEKVVKLVCKNGSPEEKLKIGVVGVTFKENVPDLRNTKVIEMVEALEEFGAEVYCYDPVCHADEFEAEYDRNLTQWDDFPGCHAMVMAVNHKQVLAEQTVKSISEKLVGPKVFIDIKGAYSRDELAKTDLKMWRL